jgi:hypothetical protein
MIDSKNEQVELVSLQPGSSFRAIDSRNRLLTERIGAEPIDSLGGEGDRVTLSKQTRGDLDAGMRRQLRL